MKLNRIKRRTSSSLVLELTPLIDVIFLLLIFFMVATTFEDMNTNISIELPTSTVKSNKAVDEIQVIITKNKEYYVKIQRGDESRTDKIKKDELYLILKEELGNSESKNVIISADKNLDHGEVVNTMTAAKEAGAISLDIDTASSKK